MSLVIAIQDKDRVIVGADSQATCAYIRKEVNVDPRNCKIRKLDNGIILGNVGNVKYFEAMDETDFPNFKADEGLSCEYLFKNFIPNYKQIFEDLRYDDDKKPSCAILIIFKNKIYYIDDYFSVFAMSNFFAMGVMCDIANQYCLRTELPPKERILQALRDVTKYNFGVQNPYIFIDSQTLQVEIVKE